MKISVSFTLLLLLGAVSAGDKCEHEDDEQPDSMVQLIKLLQTLAAEQALLRAKEDKPNTEVDKLKAEVTKLKTDVDTQKAEVSTQKAEVSTLKAEVDKLKQQQLGRQVAFSASLAVAGELSIGPVPSDTTLVFKYVPTNIGNAYNSTTGVFTAPVRGAYHFEFHNNGHNGRSTAAFLVKNTQNVFAVHESQPGGFMSTSNGVTLLLEVGDKVFVRLAATSHVFDNFNHHTTFSGHLLFPM